MVLSNGYLAVAMKLQEAADMGHSDVRKRLSDSLNDMTRGTGDYAYYVDHTGDGSSGDVIYSKNGDLRKASYETGSVGGKATCNVDDEGSANVVPSTTYQEEADEDDHYAGMEESFKSSKLYTGLPLYERFISKGERAGADEGSFAGKGKSFPILKPGDVTAAVHAMGRAGTSNYGMAQLKANIIRIAKAKGWTSSLPKSWRDGGDSKEAAVTTQTGALQLTESAATLEQIVLKEAKSDYEIKLIAPGKGSSAFYPAEVLKRDGPRVFNAGTHVYLNHPTSAEEAARPEGNVANLAGVLTTAARYDESHAKGPGLYARMKVFADHATVVEEKAPHVGMSIRASGVAESGKTKDGVPVLKELTSAESVDVVTRAGAGGMILTESARGANQEEKESDMDNAAIMQLHETLKTSLAKIDMREARAAAKEITIDALEGLNLPKAAKTDIWDRCSSQIVLKDGALDETKFAETLKAETTRVANLVGELTGSGRVVGMGPSGGLTMSEAAIDPKAEKKRLKEAKRQEESLRESEESVFANLMGNKDAAKFAVSKGQAA